MIKHKVLLIVFLVVASVVAPSITQAQSISIAIGDRPYYRGNRYWHDDYEMIWVPGRWAPRRHHWIRGHYVRGVHRSNWRGRGYHRLPHERIHDRVRDRF
jgi:hypothetical protein